jgi:hypothetical protein
VIKYISTLLLTCFSLLAAAQEFNTIPDTAATIIAQPTFQPIDFTLDYKNVTVATIATEITINYTGQSTQLPAFLWINNETKNLTWQDNKAIISYALNEEKTNLQIAQVDYSIGVSIIP